MRRLNLLSILFVTFLAACSQAETEEPTTPSSEVTTDSISFSEVTSALDRQGLFLEEAKLPEENPFIQDLNGVSPEVYFLEGKTLSIYTFPTVEERKEGMEDFEELTATMELVLSETFTKENIVIFYVFRGEEEKETIRKLRNATESLS